MFKAFSKKKHPHIVCYFQRSRLSVYIPSRNEVAALDFPPTILADITVVDQDQFRKAITKLLAQYKVEESPVLVVLATDVCFMQEIEANEKKEEKPVSEVVKELRSSMPYANVFARSLQYGKHQVAIALNREFYEPLLAVFRDEGFEVTTLVPELVLGQSLTESGLTPEIAVQLTAAIDKLDAFDLLKSEEKPKIITATAQTPEDKKRTLLLVGVFVVLVLILVGVWWWVNRPGPTPTPIVPVVPVLEEPIQPAPELLSAPEATTAAASESGESAVEGASPSAELEATPAAAASTAGELPPPLE